MEKMTNFKSQKSSCLFNKNKKIIVRIKIIVIIFGVDEKDCSNKQTGQSVS